jgi:hypothetical protein
MIYLSLAVHRQETRTESTRQRISFLTLLLPLEEDWKR